MKPTSYNHWLAMFKARNPGPSLSTTQTQTNSYQNINVFPKETSLILAVLAHQKIQFATIARRKAIAVFQNTRIHEMTWIPECNLQMLGITYSSGCTVRWIFFSYDNSKKLLVLGELHDRFITHNAPTHGYISFYLTTCQSSEQLIFI